MVVRCIFDEELIGQLAIKGGGVSKSWFQGKYGRKFCCLLCGNVYLLNTSIHIKTFFFIYFILKVSLLVKIDIRFTVRNLSQKIYP